MPLSLLSLPLSLLRLSRLSISEPKDAKCTYLGYLLMGLATYLQPT